MAVHKRGNAGIYYYRFMYNGKLYSRSCKTTNKKVALQIEAQTRLNLLKQDELGVKPYINFYQALQLVEDDINSRAYKSSIPNFIRHIKLNLDDKQLHKLNNSDLFHLLTVLKNKGLKPSTLSNYFAIVRQANDRAKKLGYLTNYDLEMPVKRVKQERVRIISKDQEDELLSLLEPSRKGQGLANDPDKSFLKHKQRIDNYDFTVMLLDTGCRYSEIAKLQWSDINLETKKIKVWRGKTKIETHLIMTDRVKTLLKRRAKEKDSSRYIFTDLITGTHRNYASIAIRTSIKKVHGLEEFSLHDLRHSCASKLIQNGMSLYETSIILGHRDLSTTMQYAHLATDDISQKAADILNDKNNEPETLDLTDVDTTKYDGNLL